MSAEIAKEDDKRADIVKEDNTRPDIAKEGEHSQGGGHKSRQITEQQK